MSPALCYFWQSYGFARMTEHEKYMERCLWLAAAGAGQVDPNPMVGSVIVCRGRIIGEGFHREYGGPMLKSMPWLP